MRYLLTLAMLVLALGLRAQGDKVYLKNGSLLRGQVLKIDAKLLTVDLGETVPVNISIANLRAIRLRRKKTALSDKEIQEADAINRSKILGGFRHQVRLGLVNGEDGSTNTSFSNLSFDYTLLYALSHSWTIGVGAGLDQYPSFQTVPVGFELRKDLGLSPSPFFLYMRLGYALAEARGEFFGPRAEVHGGEFFAMGVGQQWSLGKSAILVSAGYRTQSIESFWRSGDFGSRTEWNLNRLDFKVGFIF